MSPGRVSFGRIERGLPVTGKRKDIEIGKWLRDAFVVVER